MWLLWVLWVSDLLLCTLGQDWATLSKSSGGRGRCQYTFTVRDFPEANCPAPPSGAVEALHSRLGLLEALVSRLVGADAGSFRVDAGSSPQAGLQEAYDQALEEKNELSQEKERVERQVQDLQRRVEELLNETAMLRARPCPPQPPPPRTPQGDISLRPASGVLSHLISRQSDTSGLRDPGWHTGDSGYQELKAEFTEVSAPHSENSTGCGELLAVGDPVTHRKADNIAGKYGVWMQDPEPVGPYGASMVWRIDTVGTEVRQLFGYEDMAQFSRGFPTKVLVLPEPVEGTGAAVYRGALYYQRRRSRTIIRYDLASESVAARRDLPHAGFHGQFPYAWGGYTDIDLVVDESGLWAIYSTSKARGAIVLSRLDPHSLQVQRSWETGVRKNAVANAFVICGRLYTVASYAAVDTTVNYAFDTASGRGHVVSIPFRNQHQYNSMIDYNPAHRKLYAWDNFHMVSYSVRLGQQ